MAISVISGMAIVAVFLVIAAAGAYFYKKNQKHMEIIFKSADRTEDAMIAYAKKNKMKWLAIPFGKRCTTKAAGGIPHFVVYAPDGTLFAEISGSGEKSMKALNALPEQMKEWQKEHKKR